MVRAHRLLERYLHDAERVPLEDLHAEAERMEHEVAPEVLEDMDRGLGRPRLDPHGHTIPRALEELARVAGRPLDEAPPGRPCRVEMVSDDREDALRRMVGLGVLPHEIVTLLGGGATGSRVRIGEREVEIPAEIAQRIFVVPLPARADGAEASAGDSATGDAGADGSPRSDRRR